MTFNEAIKDDRQFRLADIADDEVRIQARMAINHANWFPEMNSALIQLAVAGNADEIVRWADEISAEAGQAGWGQDFADEVAANWCSVAGAVQLGARRTRAEKKDVHRRRDPRIH